jgi:hypothetical protein
MTPCCACGATLDDTGLVSLPLGAQEIRVLALFKRQSPDSLRVSRSKGTSTFARSRWGVGTVPRASQ